MQRISQWSLRCLMHSHVASFSPGLPRWNPPALRLRDPFNLAAPDVAAKVLGGLCRVVKQMKFYGTYEGIDKSESKGDKSESKGISEATATNRLPDGQTDGRVSEIFRKVIWEENRAIYKENWGFHGRLPDGWTDDIVSEGKIWEESTHRDGAIYKKNWEENWGFHERLPDGQTDDIVSEGEIWEESTHRDGAIYKKNWGFYGRGKPIDLADRRETDLESYMSKKFSPCYPYPGNCLRHPPDEMIQVCSLRLAKTPMNSDSIQLYGYLAARDFVDGRLNYVFNRSRDNPLTVQKGKLIEMTGPTRGIMIFAEVLMEFDMRIKTGENEEYDLQLIDGVAFFNNRVYVESYTLRFSGCHGGAVDMRFAHIDNAMEAVIEVDTPEVNSAFNLSLVSCLEYGEIELFHGDIGELGTKRFVIAIPYDTKIYLKFKVGKEGSEGDLVRYCQIDTRWHGCVSRQIVLEMACILVKVSILAPDPEP